MLDLDPNQDVKAWPLVFQHQELQASFPHILSGEADLEQLVAHAMRMRPELRLSANAIQGFDRAVKVYKSKRLPTLAAFANWERQNQWDLFAQKDATSNSWNAGVSLSLPLFTGFNTYSRIQKGRIDLETARLQNSELVDGIALEVETALDEVRRLHQEIEALKHGVGVATESLSMISTLRDHGKSSEIELRDASLASKAARINLAQGRFELLMAQSALLTSIGELESTAFLIRSKQQKVSQ